MTRLPLLGVLVLMTMGAQGMTLQQQLDAGGLVLLPAGDVPIAQPLRLTRPVRLVGAGAGVTRLIPSGWQPTTVGGLIEISGPDVTVEHLTVDGLKDQRPLGRTHGIWIKGGSNRVRIAHVQAVNQPSSTPEGGVGGDGICIGVDATGVHPYYVTLEDIYASENVRQGISVTAGRWFQFSNIRTRGTTGSNPGAGIDIEPDQAGHVVTDVLITNWLSESNAYGLLVVNAHSATIARVRIRQAIARKNRIADVQIGDAGVDASGIVTR